MVWGSYATGQLRGTFRIASIVRKGHKVKPRVEKSPSVSVLLPTSDKCAQKDSIHPRSRRHWPRARGWIASEGQQAALPKGDPRIARTSRAILARPDQAHREFAAPQTRSARWSDVAVCAAWFKRNVQQLGSFWCVRAMRSARLVA